LKIKGGSHPRIAGRRRLPMRGARGFTLTELLVVLTVAGVLAVIAVPSLQWTFQANRVDTAVNQFVATISVARSEAVKLGCNVNVTANANGVANSWTGGWTVVPASTCPSNVNTIASIQSNAALAGAMTAVGTVPSLAFNSLGQLAASNGPPTEADFIFCADGATGTYPMAQGVTVTVSGRARVADHPNGVPLQNDEATQMTCTAP
jgi:type IV fimbrial biogenesis protein FimT